MTDINFTEVLTNKCRVMQGDRIVIGVSGGADSVCLLLLLNEAAKELRLDLGVLHLHHGIRGEEADRDAKFTGKLCERLGVPFKLVRVDVPALAEKLGLSVEEAGRRARYEALQEYAGTCGKIAVAHNANDQQETVIMNIIRGSGLAGAAGMSYISGNIIRPLLDMSRSEIEEYLKDRNQAYCTDSTNLSDDYTRNKVRHQLMPLLQQLNASAGPHIAAFSRDCAEADMYLAQQVNGILDRCPGVPGRLQIADDLLSGQPDIIISRVIHEAICRAAGRSRDITRAHVEEVKALGAGRTGAAVSLPYGLTAYRLWNGISIESGEAGDAAAVRRREHLTVLNEGLKSPHIINYTKELIIPEKEYTKWFDYDKITESVCWRFRQEGDVIELGGVGSKPLQRFMIDRKIPRQDRDNLPVLADGHNIVWVPGHRISEKYKVGPETKKVIEISINETDIRGSLL